MNKHCTALLLTSLTAISAHAGTYADSPDCHVFATGVQNAGEYRAKGYTKKQYDQNLAERVWNGRLDEHAYLLFRRASAIAYRPENANVAPESIAAEVYGDCISEGLPARIDRQ